MQFLPSLVDTVAVGTIHYEYETLCACVVVSPEWADLVLPTYVLRGERERERERQRGERGRMRGGEKERTEKTRQRRGEEERGGGRRGEVGRQNREGMSITKDMTTNMYMYRVVSYDSKTATPTL